MSEINSVICLQELVREGDLEAFIINKFVFEKQLGSAYHKKIYLRCVIVRNHKRAMQQARSGIKPNSIHGFDMTDARALQIWLDIKEIIENNPELFAENPKEPLKMPSTVNIFGKKLNANYCKKYFSSEIVRQTYFYYIQLVFITFDINELCKKFQFSCCRSEHGVDCIEKWVLLKFFFEDFLLKDLGLEPCKGNLKIRGLPSYQTVLRCIAPEKIEVSEIGL